MSGGKVRIKLCPLSNVNIQGRWYLSFFYIPVYISGVSDNILHQIKGLNAVKNNKYLEEKKKEECYSLYGFTHMYETGNLTLDSWVSEVENLVNIFRRFGVSDIAVNIAIADVERYAKNIVPVLSPHEIATAIVYTLKQANFCEVMYKFALVDITHLEKVNGTLVLDSKSVKNNKVNKTGTKTLKVRMYVSCYTDTTIDVPANLSLEQAFEYAKKHIDDIKLGELEYIGGADELDDEDLRTGNIAFE